MKQLLKKLVVKRLASQLKQLRAKHQFKVVVVAGSIGKTSTKLAIARVLSAGLRVRYQAGNYNDIVTVPLIFFGQELPTLTNPLAWYKVFRNNQKQIDGDFPYDVVVVEVGTDAPGQIEAFGQYLTADLAILTSITPEHMANFEGLSQVAEEELNVAKFSQKMLINTDLCPAATLASFHGSFLSYALDVDATYKMEEINFGQAATSFKVSKDRQQLLAAESDGFSKPQLYSITAAVAVADLMGLNPEDITSGIKKIEPVSGRMQRLAGISNSVIIDDSYNASPDAVQAALETLYRMSAPQKIALLGNMNELGGFSEEAHRQIGQMCEPSQLDLVVTLGPEANKFLAEAAETKDCKVIKTNSPYEAGKIIAENIKEGALILVKGSQNKVYAEEAIKALLADPGEEKKLVRQSASWLKLKISQFKQG